MRVWLIDWSNQWEDMALLTYQNIDRLNDVQENFIFTIFQSFRSPGHGIGQCDRHSGRDFTLRLLALLRDEFLEDFAVGRLGIAKVHHLVQQFVDDDKVVADALLLKFLEIFLENLKTQEGKKVTRIYPQSRIKLCVERRRRLSHRRTPIALCRNEKICVIFAWRFVVATTAIKAINFISR